MNSPTIPGKNASALEWSDPIFVCPSCEHSTAGRYCGHCGEKKVDQRDFSIRHYLHELATSLTLLDSKVVRSVRTLITKPGQLSVEYFRGRRVRFLRPLQLFLFLNVVYYFSLNMFTATTFTSPLQTQLQQNNYYPAYANAQVAHKLQKSGMVYSVLETKYNEKTSVLSKTLIFLVIPIFAALFFLLFFKKRKFLVEHVVVATHFWSFILLLLGTIVPVATLLIGKTLGLFHVSPAYASNDGIASAVLQVLIGLYLFVMLRRFYLATNWYCVLTSSVIAWSFFHLVWLYRFFLFETTLQMI